MVIEIVQKDGVSTINGKSYQELTSEEKKKVDALLKATNLEGIVKNKKE